jgi:hypothetical protein
MKINMIRHIQFISNFKLITLTCFYLAVPVMLNSHIPNALAYTDMPDSLDRGDIAEIFEFGSGIFAALLCALSLSAYKKIKLKRILYVSIAFGLIAIGTIVSHTDIFIPEVESSIVEMVLAIMSFVALSLFFIAIVRKEKITSKARQFWT